MPELPEVETIRRGLARLIVGKKVIGAENFTSAKSFPNASSDVEQFLYSATITDVRRRAKVLLIDLSSEYTLVTHLKMTGQLVWIADTSREASFRGRSADGEFISSSSGGGEPLLRWGGGHPNDSFVRTLPDNTTRERLDFSDGSQLYFNDLRKFGWMRLVPTFITQQTATGSMPAGDTRRQGSAEAAVQSALQSSTGPGNEVAAPELSQSTELGLVAGESGIDAVVDFMQKVGPEPLEDAFTSTEFIPRVRKRNGTTIKAAILDQTVLAGVGNIYADESLWSTKLHPATRVRDVSDAKLSELLVNIKAVMNLSIEKGGSTDKNYVDARGNKGSYLAFANVFRREGQPCPRHPDVLIEKIRVAGRGTHVCPVCQPVPQ